MRSVRKTPLVSIGIPFYGSAKELKRVLGCLSLQTYKHVELIISDNASPDPKIEPLMHSYCKEDYRLRYFRQPQNQGAVKNFAFVLRQAKGEFFMWAAADDYWNKNFIACCLEMLHKEETLSGAFCYFSNADLLGHEFRFFSLPAFGPRNFKTIFHVVYEHEFLGKANPIYSVFRRNKLLKAFHISPLTEETFSDVALVTTVQCLGGIRIIPQCLFRKTQPLIFPLKKNVAERAYINSSRIVTNGNYRAYVMRLLKIAVSCNALTPVFLALFCRGIGECVNFFKRCLTIKATKLFFK